MKLCHAAPRYAPTIVSIQPTNSPAITTPPTLVMPASMTTASTLSATCPSCGVTPLTEAVMMPEAAASSPASAHASRNTARMLMPRLSAVSWSVEVARIAVPAREKR